MTIRGRRQPVHRRRRDPLRDAIPGALKAVAPVGCPNTPPCPHLGAFHDVEDFEDPSPTCCAEGCTCGKAPGSSAFLRAELVAILDGCPEPTTPAEWPYVRETCLVPHILEWAGRWAEMVALSGSTQNSPNGGESGDATGMGVGSTG